VATYLYHYDIKNRGADDIIKGFSFSPIVVAAFDGEKIIGIIRGRKEKIINLFVNGRYHKQGIGRQLVSKFELLACRQGAKFIKICASPYAVEFYKKVGYKKTTGVRLKKGLKYQPMKKYLL
jgi:GNAT superfamily N-acetyltransferase